MKRNGLTMAKPEHTAYQVQADFRGRKGIPPVYDEPINYTGPVAIADSCIKGGSFRAIQSYRRKKDVQLAFSMPESGHVTFGYSKAEDLLKKARKAAKLDFNKGERPSFFLRKLTMSEFIAHKQFKNYKGNAMIKTLYKKYLLMDLLSEKGFQMS